MCFFDITCPFYYLFNIPCPTCKMTRALISLCLLDFNGYVQYNSMALPTLIAVLIMINLENFKHKKTLLSVSLILLFTNLVYYIFRTFIK